MDMEPVSVSLGMLAAVLVSKAAERAGEHAGDAGAGALRRFTDWLRDRLLGRDIETTALERVHDAPDSASRVRALGAALDQRAEEDVAFREGLSAQIEQARKQGVEMRALAQIATGDQNVQVAEVQGSVTVAYTERPSSPPAR
jgi:hypothetical protein